MEELLAKEKAFFGPGRSTGLQLLYPYEKKKSFTVPAFWFLPQLHWLKKEFDGLSREAVACNGESSTLNGASFSHWSTVQKFYWMTSFHRTMSIHQRCLILPALCNIVFGDYSASNPSRPSQLHFHHWDSHMQTMICGHRFDSKLSANFKTFPIVWNNVQLQM